jgi:uncharacterized caspase-like protein
MRSSRLLIVILAVVLFLLNAIDIAAQDKKVALVIGNSAYRAVQPLQNPVNDATDIAAALQRMGFKVLVQTDLDRKAMRGLIDDFNKAIQGADVALFFYSGHGVQLDGENYLVPVSAEVAVKDDVPDECISLSRITGRMNEAGAKTNVIFLDACRDNPFKAVSRGIDRGLAVLGQKPPDSIIVYATAENEKAEDGGGRNGTFTAALLKNIERRESLTDILFDVNAQVRRETADKQKPALYENMTHPVFLAGGKAAAQPDSRPMTSANKTPSPAAPTLSVTRLYGSLSVTASIAGTLYLDGQEQGNIEAGELAKLDSVEVGDRSLEMRYADGHVETREAVVQKGKTTSVAFAYAKAAAKPFVSKQGTLWVVSSKGEISCRNGGSWQKMPGEAQDVGVGADGSVWITGAGTSPGADGDISFWNGSGWTKVDGAGARIAVAPDGNPWMVNSGKEIFRRVDGSWRRMPGAAQDIGVGADGSVWVIGASAGDGGIFFWTGSGWAQIDGGAIRVAVAPDGSPWVVNSGGAIYRRITEGPGGSWTQMPGLAKDIGVGSDGSVWIISLVSKAGADGDI